MLPVLSLMLLAVPQQVSTSQSAGGGAAAGGTTNAWVDLQPSTPGYQQVGHFHVSGTATAGEFSGSGVGLTNLPWSSLVNVPSGFADGNDDGYVLGSGSLWFGSSDMMSLTQMGTGKVATFVVGNSSNTKTALYAGTAGSGLALDVLKDGPGGTSAAQIAWHPSTTQNSGSALWIDSSGYLGLTVNATGARGLHVQHNPSSPTTGWAMTVSDSGGGTALQVTDSNGGYAMTAVGYSGATNSKGAYISAPSGQTGLVVAGGTKNGVVATSKGARLLYSEESTEVWFSDYGFGTLQNGVAHVAIDPLYAETIDLGEPYHVFVQLNDASAKGTAVERKTATGFDVVELDGGSSSAEFSFRIVAKRKRYAEQRLERLPDAELDANVYSPEVCAELGLAPRAGTFGAIPQE